MASDSGDGHNLQFELTAYERADCVRAAMLIGADDTLTRAALRERWAARYPQHAPMTGRRSIATRVTDALWRLKVAGMIATSEDGQDVEVTGRALLEMSARNTGIVLNGDGGSEEPRNWQRRPEVPQHLLDIQAVRSERGAGPGYIHGLAAPEHAG